MAKAVRKAKQSKPKKETSKYDTTLKINASFEDAMKVLVKPINPIKKK